MNLAILIGRLTKDVEVRYTSGDEPFAVAKFSIAVDRRGKDSSADFINCIAYKQTAENIEKYFHKGSKIGIQGNIKTGSYDKDGHKVYTTDIVVDKFDFLDKKDDAPAEKPVNDGFLSVPDGVDDDALPFN